MNLKHHSDFILRTVDAQFFRDDQPFVPTISNERFVWDETVRIMFNFEWETWQFTLLIGIDWLLDYGRYQINTINPPPRNLSARISGGQGSSPDIVQALGHSHKVGCAASPSSFHGFITNTPQGHNTERAQRTTLEALVRKLKLSQTPSRTTAAMDDMLVNSVAVRQPGANENGQMFGEFAFSAYSGDFVQGDFWLATIDPIPGFGRLVIDCPFYNIRRA